jgi:LuxR family maltose regulon positive regulatory protein
MAMPSYAGAQDLTLLTTKLYIPPPLPNLVERPRLVKRLDEGLRLGHRLTLISAPAGFGKTTLVSDWLRKTDFPVAWLSLDESDNDPARFLIYFIAALSRVEGTGSTFGKGALTMLQSSQPPATDVVLTALINEVAAFPDRIILVLDDYQTIASSSVDDALTFLLENLPPRMHLVIATREDPHLPLARLRAQGQLTELRATDLRFSSSEAAEFLNQAMDLDLSTEHIAALEARTEGWIAGLQLAAISMQGRKDATSFINSFSGSHRFILDYLIEEVLGQQSEHVQTFLLQTAILDRLTGSLCDAVCGASCEDTGQDDGRTTLEMLEHANLFLVPLDEERRWYRYHHLFADLLRQRLHQTQPDWVPALHRRASGWYQDHGFVDEAIEHALRGEDFTRAAHLIEKYADALWQRGEHITVSNWTNALPDSLVRERPYLCVYHAWALQLTGQFDAAEARLSAAEEALTSFCQENDADAKTIRGHVHSHRAYLTFIRGEHAKTINYARQALEQLPPEATVIRTQTALYLGVAYRFQGELQAALDIFTEAVASSQKIGQ